MKRQPYLDAVAERVVVFDGAFGTYIQGLDLGPDDFGGAGARGLQRDARASPGRTSSATMHAEFFEVGVDAVETATLRRFSTVLNEYGIADKAYEINVAGGPPRPGGRPTGSTADGRPATSPARSVPAPSCRRSATSASPSCATTTRSRPPDCSTAASTCSSSRPCMDLLQAKAAMIACRRAMAAAGREVPMQVQVTMETTGRMLVGSEIGAALVALEAMRPDVIGLNCATGPAEMTEHLRYLAQHCAAADLVPAQRGPAQSSSTATRTTTSRPSELAECARALRRRVRPQHRRRLLRHHARAPAPSSSASATSRRRRRTPKHEPSVLVDLQPGHVPPGARVPRIGERTNANGSKVPRRDARGRLGHVRRRWPASR